MIPSCHMPVYVQLEHPILLLFGNLHYLKKFNKNTDVVASNVENT